MRRPPSAVPPIKNPNHGWLGQRIKAVAPPPRKGLAAESGVGFLACDSSYSLRLPKANASVVFADFVSLTVAGQRWLRTIFPSHSIGLRDIPTFVIGSRVAAILLHSPRLVNGASYRAVGDLQLFIPCAAEHSETFPLESEKPFAEPMMCAAKGWGVHEGIWNRMCDHPRRVNFWKLRISRGGFSWDPRTV